MMLFNTTDIFAIKTGLLSSQLQEKKTLSLSAKAVQLERRRYQRRMRKHLVTHSLKRKMKLAGRNINKRRMVQFKANRKRRKTIRIFRRKRK